MSAGTVMPSPKFIGLDNDGNSINGGKLYTFLAGTTTPAQTYSDQALLVPNANPVILDSSGRATVFLDNLSYKFELRLADDTLLYTQDNVVSVGLFVGKLATLIPFGHTIGNVTPNDNVQLTMGGPMPIPASAASSFGIDNQPIFDATLAPSIASIIGQLLRPTFQLGAAGTPNLYGMNFGQPIISTAGAVPPLGITVYIEGAPVGATEKYAFFSNFGPIGLAGPVHLQQLVAVTATLVADQNNWAPSFIDTSNYLLINPSGAIRTITGIASYGASAVHATNNTAGRMYLVRNNGANNLQFAHESGSSAAANRFQLPGAATYAVTPGAMCMLYYDSVVSRWVVLGK